MSLIFDQRASLQGQSALHALIIGVSDYPHLPKNGDPPTENSFGMEKLSSPALSAYRVFEWLSSRATSHPVPLASCRMLLLPSAAEIATEPGLAAFAGGWGINEVVTDAAAWRQDASQVRDSRTFFYFAGHGARRSQHDCVMILPGFGSGAGGILAACIDTSTLRDGMAPTARFPDIARTQMYVVDACRITPQEFRQFERMPTYGVFDVEVNDIDDRKAPIFYAAIPGTVAIGRKGKQTLFSDALLQCLRGAAGEAMEEDPAGNVPWRVSVTSLNEALVKIVNALNDQFGTDQQFEPGASVPFEICKLAAAPKVKVMLRLSPEQAGNAGKLSVTNSLGDAVWTLAPPLGPLPLSNTLEAGNYRIEISFGSPNLPFRNYTRLKMILPPQVELTARCSP